MSAVAGDFYDFRTLENNQLGILVADVTGHGVPAALIASMLKIAFAGQTALAQRPERVLVALNQVLCGKSESLFVTAAYLYADLDAKIVPLRGSWTPSALAQQPFERRRSIDRTKRLVPRHVPRSCLLITRNPAQTRRSLCALHGRACPNPETPLAKNLASRVASNFSNPILVLQEQRLLTHSSAKSPTGPPDLQAACRKMT